MRLTLCLRACVIQLRTQGYALSACPVTGGLQAANALSNSTGYSTTGFGLTNMCSNYSINTLDGALTSLGRTSGADKQPTVLPANRMLQR